MNRLEHILTTLQEEAFEIAHQISKAKRFGIWEQRDLPTSNAERILAEYNDFLAMAELLEAEIGTVLFVRSNRMIEEKKAKFEKYLEYSKECGTLTND